MQPWMVHVERRDLQAWDIAVSPGEGMRSIIIRTMQSPSVSIKENIGDSNDYGRMETWYCRNKAEAELLAMKLALEMPSRSIYVLELKSITQTGTTPPVVSNVTEKGVLPR